MKKFLFVIFMVVGVSSCATNSTIFNNPMNQDALDSLIKNSPVIKRITNVNYEVVSTPGNVKLFYKNFNFFNRPDLIKNWQLYYVLGKSSNPISGYEKIAEIEIYLPNMDDSKGILTLKDAASRLGATGLIDVYKKPLTATGNVKRLAGFSRAVYSVDTYLYYGLAIREK